MAGAKYGTLLSSGSVRTEIVSLEGTTVIQKSGRSIAVRYQASVRVFLPPSIRGARLIGCALPDSTGDGSPIGSVRSTSRSKSPTDGSLFRIGTFQVNLTETD